MHSAAQYANFDIQLTLKEVTYQCYKYAKKWEKWLKSEVWGEAYEKKFRVNCMSKFAY